MERKAQRGPASVLGCASSGKVRGLCGGASLPTPAKMRRDDAKGGTHLSPRPRAVLRVPHPLFQGAEPNSSAAIPGASTLWHHPLLPQTVAFGDRGKQRKHSRCWLPASVTTSPAGLGPLGASTQAWLPDAPCRNSRAGGDRRQHCTLNSDRSRAATVSIRGAEPLCSERRLQDPVVLPPGSTIPSSQETYQRKGLTTCSCRQVVGVGEKQVGKGELRPII